MSGTGAGWYYDSVDGDVIHQNLAESLANVLVSYYYGPYATEAEAMAEGEKLHSESSSNAAPSENESVSQQASNTAGTVASSVLGLPTFSGVRNLVIRAAMVVIGGALILIGLARLTDLTDKIPEVIPV